MEDPEQLVLNMVEDVITAKEEANPPAAVASEPQEAEKTEKKKQSNSTLRTQKLGKLEESTSGKTLGDLSNETTKKIRTFLFMPPISTQRTCIRSFEREWK